MLDAVREVARLSGPFSTVSLDATRSGESKREVPTRFRALADELRAAGAPDADIAALHEASTSLPGRGGPLTRLTVARQGQVVLDLVLPGAPPRDECAHGPAPHLLPVARALRFPAPYLVVAVDRSGADIEVVNELGAVAGSEQVQGSHDVLHKVPAGGWSHRRMQARVQDSWDRNAAEVGAELDRVVAEVAPVAVLLDGDPYAMGALSRSVNRAVADLLIRLSSGGRAAGTDEHARREAIDQALSDRERANREDLVQRYSGALARQQEAVQGLDAVVDAIRRSQVERVLLHDDPVSTATLWSGPEPLQIGTDRGALVEMGVTDPWSMRGDAVLSRAVFASGADIVLLEAADIDLIDGIGAMLRWSDRATPHAAVPAMPGHGQDPGIGG